MKDLTAYFGSPSKESSTPAKEVPDSNKKAEQKIEEQSETADEGSVNIMVNIANNNDDVKTVAKKKRKSKRGKMRKPSDPAVKNITELMTNNLSIISPNTSMAEMKTADRNIFVDAEVKNSNKLIKEETKGSNESKNFIEVKIKADSDKLTETISRTEDSNNPSIVIGTETKASSNDIPIAEIPSPNCSDKLKVLKAKTASKNKSSSIIIDCESSSSSDNQSGNSDRTKVVNAFQFLMDSRLKTIGSNSPGKEIDKETSKDYESKEKLSARKNLLSDWAEKKGASKRKREEDDKEAIIRYKLEKRAKRLKKLLKVKAENNEVVKMKQRRIKKIPSDTESSNDATIQSEDIDLKNEIEKHNMASDTRLEKSTHKEKETINKKNVPEIEENTRSNEFDSSEENDTSTASPTDTQSNIERKHNEVIAISDDKKGNTAKNNSSKMSNRKLKKPDNIEKENKNSRLNEFFDESAQDIEICNSKPKEGRQSLLNFFGVINRSDKTENVNKTPLKIHSKEKTAKEKDQVKPNSKKLKLDVEVVELKVECDTNMTKTAKSKVIFDLPAEELIPTTHNTTETEDASTCDHALQDTPQSRKSKKSKKKKKLKEEKTSKVQKILDESSQENDLTPRRLRSWRMKIRMNLDENTDESCKTFKSVVLGTEVDESSCAQGDTKDSDVVSLSSGSDFEDEIKTKKPLKKAAKVAPVFVKAAPKPKIDPEILEARKQFLMSGIPDSLKKCMEKHQSLEEREYDVFPTVSHVQQKCNSNFWNLPESNLELVEFSPIKLDKLDFTHCLPAKKTKKLNIKVETDKITELKSILNKIKTENPNYPVLKAFRQISERKESSNNSGQEKQLKAKKKSKKRHKSPNTSVEIVQLDQDEIDVVAQAMWTEKYKPRNSDDIIGNTEAIKSLKKWLEAWWNFSEEIINSKRRRKNSNSSDDFVVSDCSSRDTVRLPGNTVVLEGPCGSGKSTAVYAICNELGFNVIEINASSKRTGKHLLQKLQEATQSHQVRKKESSSFQNFLQQTDSEETDDKQMCVLFVEDIDIVFEQDDNFIPALMQLVTTSKRPIILTTTYYESVFVQRSLGDFERISFMPLSGYSLATWLQLVCLAEGMFMDQDEIGSLLEFNKGDVRKTLLELQFWVQSGGEIVKSDMPIKIEYRRSSTEKKLVENDVKNDKRKTRNAEKVVMHKNCMRSFEIFDGPYDFSVPYHLKLGLLWWNFPSILNMPDFSRNRVIRLKVENKVTSMESSCEKRCSPEDRLKLIELSRVYDTVCVSDVLFRKMKITDDSEPVVKNAKYAVRDSTELCSKIDDEVLDLDSVHEMSHYLVNGQIQRFKRVNEGEASLNMAVPDKSERRWRTKQYMCEDLFKEAVSCSTSLDRKAVAMDYMPTMRCICRSENERASHNTKRGNRFRNYLRNLVKHCNDNTFKLACNILRE